MHFLKKYIGFFLLILLLGSVLLVAGDSALAYSGRLCRGLFIADVPVGGLLPTEAETKVAIALRERHAKSVAELQFEDKKWNVDWDAVVGKPDAATLVRRAYDIGRTGNLWERLRWQFITACGESVVPLGVTPNEEKLRAVIVAAASYIDRESVNASIEETPTGLKINNDSTGRKTDVNNTLQDLIRAIVDGNAGPVSLRVQEFPAVIRVQDLRQMDSRLSSFSTTYDASDENRARNIQIAAEKLAGILIKSGEVFSFNDKVGLRTPEQGYKMAPTLTSAGSTMDWGGGVCQVSSTLYNAALLADFAVIDRSPHYQPPSYVPLGQDATVADGLIDLRLKNVRNHVIYLQSVAEMGKVEVRIYGKREHGAPTILIETVEKAVQIPHTIVLQDPLLPLGQEVVESSGRNGFIVTVQRVKMQGQKEIGREDISTDEFEGEDRVVRVGTGTIGGKTVK